MKTDWSYLPAAVLIAFALESSAGTANAETLTPPAVPPALRVPDGNTPMMIGHATGTQNYLCVLSTTGAYTWKFIGPQATLHINYKLFNTELTQQVTTHFLSPNPTEGGTARPTWQSSLDTSAVWGNAIANSSDPNFVTPGAIPWLLLQVVGTQRGPTGGSLLTSATYIHRVNTSGGTAPSLPCSESVNNGLTMFVPYTADYVFYWARRN